MFDCLWQIRGIRRRAATGPRRTAVISCGGVWSLWSVSHAAPRPLLKRIKKLVSYRYRIRLTAKNRCIGIGRKWRTRSNTIACVSVCSHDEICMLHISTQPRIGGIHAHASRVEIFLQDVSVAIVFINSLALIKDVQWSGWVWMGECFFWYQPTQVVPVQRLFKWLCVCVIVWLWVSFSGLTQR